MKETQLKSNKQIPLFFPFVLQDGETALYQAVKNGHDACALALLEAGCEPNIFMVW